MHAPCVHLLRALAGVLALLASVLALAVPALAHPPLTTTAVVRVEPPSPGALDHPARLRVVVVLDALAFALNEASLRVRDEQMYALLEGPRADLEAALQDARERFDAGVVLEIDGVRVPLTVTKWPGAADLDVWRQQNPRLPLPVKLAFEVEVEVAAGARAFTLRLPEVLHIVLLSVERPQVEPLFFPLQPAEISPRIDLLLPSPSEPADAGAVSVPRDAPRGSSSPPSILPPLTPVRAPAHPLSALDVAGRYLALGFHHIIPAGTDHALFIFGLFLLSTRFKDLLWQVTAFTLAHTCTLTLAALGLVSAPPALVEPVIAATIAFVALENVILKPARAETAAADRPPRLRARTLIAFAFGLVHGLGFATALSEVGLPAGQLAAALAAFSVGVECGHLAILLAAFAVLGWCRGKRWYRPAVAVPLSLAIAAISLWWFVERVWG